MPVSFTPSSSSPPSSATGKSVVEFLSRNAENILHLYTPVVWCALFVAFESRESLLAAWYMPLLGVVAAFLANAVPIGGGIVYIPALSLLGAQIPLGASFSIATMPVGNGLFGFLRWLRKDPSVFIWESFAYTVLPSWIGSLLAMYALPAPNTVVIKLFFGVFCFFIGVLVVLALYRGGLRNVFFNIPERESESERDSEEDNRFDSEIPLADPFSQEFFHKTMRERDERERLLREPEEETALVDAEAALRKHWLSLSSISFLGGVVLVPNIGIGPALVTYFVLVLLGYPEQRAMVTGIVTGGWVCVLPFAVHILRGDVPYELWVLVLPGVFYGAKFAPFLIEWAGKENVMKSFAVFLFFSALLFWFH